MSGEDAGDSALASPRDPDAAWCIAGHGTHLTVGPERALGGRSDVRVRVAIGEPLAASALGEVVEEIRVSESGLRDFTVTWHDTGTGTTVAVNPAGGNQIGWSAQRDAFWLTAGRDALVSSVHQRFLLRHLTTVLLEHDLGGRSIHAVTTKWGDGVLAVAGPTCSGKTRLVNHLAGAGLVGAVIDDDCPIVTATGDAVTLVPRRYEVETACGAGVSAMVVLSDSAQPPHWITPARAHELLLAMPVPWPATWLPNGTSPPLPELRHDLPVLEVPAQDEAAHSMVAAIVAAGFSSAS